MVALTIPVPRQPQLVSQLVSASIPNSKLDFVFHSSFFSVVFFAVVVVDQGDEIGKIGRRLVYFQRFRIKRIHIILENMVLCHL